MAFGRILNMTGIHDCYYAESTRTTSSNRILDSKQQFVLSVSECPTGPDAITSCVGKPDGDYQHCYRCSSFVTCSNEILYEMPCPHPLIFDVNSQKCLKKSYSCHCRIYKENGVVSVSFTVPFFQVFPVFGVVSLNDIVIAI